MLIAQRSERQTDQPVPMRWHELLDTLSYEEAGIGATDRGWWHALTGQARLFSWSLSFETITIALRGRGLIYLCWGIPKRSGWKEKLVKKVLHGAEYLLVNDTTTQREIEVLCGRRADLVPFFVDTNFFVFTPYLDRWDFLFCPGSNDRDPKLLVALAEYGFKIIWLVNNSKLYNRYKAQHPNLKLYSNISYQDLRKLYQTCAASIMPMLHDRHCAGQTTGMEAVACGAPLFISEGRTSGIFSNLPSVFPVVNNDIEAWTASLRILQYQQELDGKTTQARTIFENWISPKNVKKILKTFLV